MFSRFFIDRPIFATVLSVLITLGGALAVFNLPLSQYPPVTPPIVRVYCGYPGASAQVVAETVAAPIEQQVNGVEDMLYMVSQCANDGSYGLQVTFKHGVNLNLAQVLVQNRVNLALPKLPDVLKQTGVTTRKQSPDFVMSVNIYSPHNRYDQLYMSNYALKYIKDEMLRIPGVSDVFVMGQRDYAMRIWVDPEQLYSRSLTAGDVVNAIREQNKQVASGQIGQSPTVPGQMTQITLSTLGRLKSPEQFENIVIRAMPDGRVVRIKDVGRVELGARGQDVTAKIDGRPSAGLMVSQLPDANALDVAGRIIEKMDDLAKNFPDDLVYDIQYDTTPYTRDCIKEVFKSLRDAIILVAFVVLLFLQNWRSAIIPLVAVPVAIIGTFGVMALLGFSLNNLTLFGLVLAIGIVVDDAIVVVEAVEHHIENGMNPRDATVKAMSQVSGPVMAVGLVLSAVFVPCAFISGITGQFFRQFALTIAASTIISTFNSLTLSPALSAMLLRERDKETHEALPRLIYPLLGGWLGYQWLGPWLAPHVEKLLLLLSANMTEQALTLAEWTAGGLAIGLLGLVGWLAAKPMNGLLRWGFHGFDAGFRFTANTYLRIVGMMLRVSVLVLVVYGGLLLLTYWSFKTTPKGFIPPQDMGNLMINVQLPDAASVERCRKVVEHVQEIALSTPGVKHALTIAGSAFSIGVSAANFGTVIVILDAFANREEPGLSADEIAAKLRIRCDKEVPEARIGVFPSPPIRGVGRTGGFTMMVEDRGDQGPKVLEQQANLLQRKADQFRGPGDRQMVTMQPVVYRANSPQLFADLNRVQCMAMGVPLADAFSTLQIYLGSLYVNDFNLFGRTWAVVVQAEAKFRNRVESARQLTVRNNQGNMVPIGSLADIREINGPLVLFRFNMYPAAAVNGSTAPGVSSRQAIDLMQQLADSELLPAMRCEWTEMAYLELQAGNTAMVIFGLAVVMVFLVLAAQYESWSLPLAVILVVPMCLLSSITGVTAVPGCLQAIAEAVKPHSTRLAYAIAGVGMPKDINIFTQIGFVVLVGLASKNAILIVEFAKRQRESGMPRNEAALAACKLRLRPIVMTSFAFILGVSPLLISHGAGSEMRRTLGTAVFSGMLGVTVFGVFLTPVFFIVVDRLGGMNLFHTRLARWLRFLTLFFFALGFVWTLARMTGDMARRAWRKSRDSKPPDDPDKSN